MFATEIKWGQVLFNDQYFVQSFSVFEEVFRGHLLSTGYPGSQRPPWSQTDHFRVPKTPTFNLGLMQEPWGTRKWLIIRISEAPNVNFRKISVRKTIWDLEFSEHLLQNFLLACLSLAWEAQTYFRWSRLSLRKWFSEGEKRRPEIRLRFAGCSFS